MVITTIMSKIELKEFTQALSKEHDRGMQYTYGKDLMYVMTARQTMLLLSEKQWHIQIWCKESIMMLDHCTMRETQKKRVL